MATQTFILPAAASSPWYGVSAISYEGFDVNGFSTGYYYKTIVETDQVNVLNLYSTSGGLDFNGDPFDGQWGNLGLIFSGITPPAGITKVELSVNVMGLGPGFDVRGVKELNPVLWSNPTRVPSTEYLPQSKTSAVSTIYNPLSQIHLVDVTTVYNEIVGQGGWVSGNNIGFILSLTSLNGGGQISSSKAINGANRPQLVFTYTPPTRPYYYRNFILGANR